MNKSLVLLIAIGLGMAPAAPEAQPEKVVLVLPFENSTGQSKYEPLEEGLRDLFMADLSRQEGISVVEREKLGEVTRELGLGFRGLADEKDVAKVGRMAGATMALSGGFLLENDRLVIDAHLYDVETTRLVRSERAKGEIGDIVDIERELVGKLLEDLEVKKTAPGSGKTDRQPSVTLHYIRGLGHYYVGRYGLALREFMETLLLDPDFDDARLFRARTYFKEKEYQHCLIELRKLLARGDSYPKRKEAQELLRECEEKIKGEGKSGE